jgi:hypothetical protein
VIRVRAERRIITHDSVSAARLSFPAAKPRHVSAGGIACASEAGSNGTERAGFISWSALCESDEEAKELG